MRNSSSRYKSIALPLAFTMKLRNVQSSKSKQVLSSSLKNLVINIRGVVLKKMCGNAVPTPNEKEDCTK